MKVAVDSTQVSALSAWLQGADAARESQQHAASTAIPAADTQEPGSGRDLAEGLLQLDVWNGAPASARSLAAGSQAASAGTGSLDAAVEHIFGPLC